ncbi:ABC transporter permease [Rhizobium mesoamericanum]|uniref:Histidine/lysine/arginine/ornithine transporter subunit membrane component of ABC superfamily n=1 Tax=Rhizobium mesoamericanum STM3625 TaxID=1211777 RepID=K0PT44_9HYPH|nr:ABC transporter permease subunit [Rhizobium mesoamericanum]CCM79916.1 histidine/lysine/arginine/ornithine transporter subunit; membrane component of ABC superfamily [Rhizobium mesoamericanum STM3625]
MSDLFLLGFGKGGWGGLLLQAAIMTLAVTLASLIIGAVLGALIAWAKLSRSLPASLLGECYTVVFRGVPELLIIYLCYFGGSSLLSGIFHMSGGAGFVGIPPFVAGAFGVGLICAAYQAEVYRGAYLAVSKGEIEAAVAIGMPRLLRLRRILIPQVMRFSLPGLNNVWQMSLKDSALVSVTGLAEIMRTTDVAARTTREYFLFYVAGAALYLMLTAVSNQVVEKAESATDKAFTPRTEEA